MSTRQASIREASDDDFAALLEGRAPAGLQLPDGPLESREVFEMLRALARQIRPQFTPACWLIIDGSEVVGMASLVRQPDAGAIDIGYGIAPTRRRRGFATAAVADIVAWARTDDRVVTIRAETSIANPASQRVLERNGFIQTGQRVDPEDGPLIGWQIAAG